MEIVFGKPFEDWDEELDGFFNTAGWFFISELLERVVGEESFLEIRFQRGGEASWGSKAYQVFWFYNSSHGETRERESEKQRIESLGG